MASSVAVDNVRGDSRSGYDNVMPDCLYDLLQARAANHPDAPAISAPEREALTYGQLLLLADATVASLRRFNINREDRVALVLPNGPEMATAFLTVACGATCAPLNPAYKAEEFDFYISDTKARALIVAHRMESSAREVARSKKLPIIELVPKSDSQAGLFELDTDAREIDGTNFDHTQPQDMALILHTSGTTSRPKIVPLKHSNICTSGRNIARTLALSEMDRCLNVMPLFHIHGLMAAIVASMTAGASVICSPGFDPERFFNWMDTFKPTWYTAVPTIHQAVLSRASASKEIVRRTPLRFIRSSSASLPQPVMEELEKTFDTQVIEAYGMTEAAHQMASNPLTPLPRKANSVGLSAGPDVAIMDESGNLLGPDSMGEVVIRGANVTDGYENNTEANAQAFTNGWFRTGDQGRIDPDGYLFLTGRLKEIINRGGEKISPREVDDVLSQHPAVAQVVTFGLKHPTLGEDVAAAVVPRVGVAVSENELREFASARLSEFKVPRQILIVDEIPKGPTGKLQRIGLAEKLADKLEAKRQNNFAQATNSVEARLVEIWKNLLKIDRVGVSDDFQSLGGDSLATMTMLLEVEQHFGTEVPVDRFLATPTIQTLAEIINHKAKDGEPLKNPKSGSRVRDSFFVGLRNRLLQYAALYAPGFKSTRVWLHRLRGVKIGMNTSIGLDVLIETAYPTLVVIGDNVTLGMRTIIIGHLRDSTDQARKDERPTVRIENDVYIGPGVIVLPNVVIGRGSVVSAGSVVSRSIPPQTLARGNPAEPIARCGVSLGGGVSYEQFVRNLKPLEPRI